MLLDEFLLSKQQDWYSLHDPGILPTLSPQSGTVTSRYRLDPPVQSCKLIPRTSRTSPGQERMTSRLSMLLEHTTLQLTRISSSSGCQGHSCQEIGLVTIMFFFKLFIFLCSSQFPSMFSLTNLFSIILFLIC